MKKVMHRSVVPVYAAAGIWLVACVALPMYRLWHYVIYGLVTVAGYFLVRRFFPGTVEELPLPEAPPDSGDAEVDQLILSGRQLVSRLRELGGAIENPDITAQVEALETLTGKIFAALEEDTGRLGRTRTFLNYYLPTTVRLLERYEALEEQKSSGGNIRAAMERVEEMLEKIHLAFEKQLDHLYEAETMDITADIQVMQNMMASEGLLERD